MKKVRVVAGYGARGEPVYGSKWVRVRECRHCDGKNRIECHVCEDGKLPLFD